MQGGSRDGQQVGTLFPRRRAIPLRALAAFVLALAFPAFAADSPRCNLARLAEWPVHFVGGLPIADGAVNGKKVGVLLDTGAYASILTNAAADRLELGSRITSEVMSGFGGPSRVRRARIDELRVGEVVVGRAMSIRVGGERPIPGVDLLLGDDVFRNTDLEFDYSKGVVRLIQPTGCEGASLAYWGPDAIELPMENTDKVVVGVKLNGSDAYALVDSGASNSIVALSLAARLGITPGTPGVVPSECHGGVGADLVHSWVAKFDSFAIAGEKVNTPRLQITDFVLPSSSDSPARRRRGGIEYAAGIAPEMILGADFLRTHRVLVSRSQRKVYFSYTGGLVFPSTPAIDCDERLKGKSVKEAIAMYDRVIADNPKDTRALVNRAVLRLLDDPRAALADLDAAIRLEPGNAVAWSVRSNARNLLKDYDGAIADSDAAIANGMRNAQAYTFRAFVRRAQGDNEGAIAEFTEALKIDPHHQGALGGRARCLFAAGRYEAAESDLATLLAIRPDAFDSLWLALSRMRRGLDGRAALEQGVAKTNGEWPEPILLYLLDRLDRDALVAAARADEKARLGRECEARFYVAERLLAEGAKDEARGLLELARDRCPENFIEHQGAISELAKLR